MPKRRARGPGWLGSWGCLGACCGCGVLLLLLGSVALFVLCGRGWPCTPR